MVGNAIVEMILSSADNGNASISVSFVSGISSDMVNAMKARADLTYTITYVFDGALYKILIPAGYDLSTLLNAFGGIDLLTLIGLLGATPVL